MAILCLAQNQRIVLQRRKRTMKNYLLPIFVLLIVGCGNRNPANIVVENRIRQTEQTDSIIGDSYERDTIQGILTVMERSNMLTANQTLLNITALMK